MKNPIIQFIEELQKANCYEMDSVIDGFIKIKEEEQENEQYFNTLFSSILFEQQPLQA